MLISWPKIAMEVDAL